MSYLSQGLDIILHLDRHILSFVAQYGTGTYLLVFLVLFCETGLVITPFLPGDSLIFTLGSLSAHSQSTLHIFILLPLLIIASVLGNYVNYIIGKALGPQVFAMDNPWFLNKDHLERSQRFYEKHGGKTIIMARFIPVIRTFAPFVAGISNMKASQFHLYNIVSAVLWIGSLLCLGYFLSSIPWIQHNFSLVIYGIIVVSLLPAIISTLYRCFSSKAGTIDQGT